jgi:hypothetical protein
MLDSSTAFAPYPGLRQDDVQKTSHHGDEVGEREAHNDLLSLA